MVSGVEVRDAATVMLVRDGDAGLEVFMLRRTLNADFVGGAYVFPGGAVDDADRHSDLEPVCEGRTGGVACRFRGASFVVVLSAGMDRRLGLDLDLADHYRHARGR